MTAFGPDAGTIDEVPDPYYGGPTGSSYVYEVRRAGLRRVARPRPGRPRAWRADGPVASRRPRRGGRRRAGRGRSGRSRPVGGRLHQRRRPGRAGRRPHRVRQVRRRPAPRACWTSRPRGWRWLARCAGVPVPGVVAGHADVLVLDWIEPGRATAATGGRPRARALAGPAPGRGGRVRLAPRRLHRHACPSATRPARAGLADVLARRAGSARWSRRAVAAAALDPRARGLADRLAGRPARAGRAARAAGPGPRRPVVRQRPRRPGRAGRGWSTRRAYGGHREVDLAMLRLFGSPGPACIGGLRRGLPPGGRLAGAARGCGSSSRCSPTP